MGIRFKKTVSAILCAAVINTVCGAAGTVFAAQNNDSAAVQTSLGSSNTVVCYDSENGTGTFTGGKKIKTNDPEHAEVIYVTPGQTLTFSNESLKDNYMDIISLDIMFPNNLPLAYFSFLNGNSELSDSNVKRFKRGFIFREGKFANAQSMNGGGTQVMQQPIESNKWVHLDTCMDYKSRMCYYYIDGKFWGMVKAPDDFTYSKGFNFVLENNNADTYAYMDNVRFYKIAKKGFPLEVDKNTTYPPEAESYITLTNNMLGSNFFERDIEYNMNFENPYNSDTDIDIKAQIIKEDGILETEISKKVSLKSGEIKDEPFKFKVKEYGFYALKIVACDNVSNKNITLETKFSVSRLNTKFNYKSALCNHYSNGHGYDEIERKTELFAKAGFSMFREDLNWNMVEKSPGNYVVTEPFEKTGDVLKNNNMNRLIILGYTNKYVVTKLFGNPTSIKKFGDYVRNTVIDTKDENVEFEVWNEINHVPFNSEGATVAEYIELLKETYSVVKSIRPDATVYGMGGITKIANMYEWIEDFLKLGGQNYCDGLSIHPYVPTAPAYQSYDVLMKCKELFKKYGCEDKKLCVSEIGWTTDDYELQANRSIQYAVLSNDEVDINTYYVSQEKESTSKSENLFGFIRPWDYGWSYPDEPYYAKPVFVAFSFFNSFMNGAHSREEIKTNDEDVSIHKQKLEDGSDVLVCWANTDTEKDGCILLNTDSVDVYDKYGNKTKSAVIGGKLNIRLSQSPVYITGNFTQVGYDAKPLIITSSKKIETTLDDTYVLNIRKEFSDNAKVEVNTPDGMELIANDGFDENNLAKVVLKTGNKRVENTFAEINVYKGNLVVCKYKIPIEYKDTISANVLGTYFRSKRWQYEVTVKNNKLTDSVSGRLEVSVPDSLPESDRTVEFKNIASGGKKKLYINIPTNVMDVKTRFEGTIILDNGEKYDIKNDIYFSTIVYTDNPPVIDGNMDSDEWFENGAFDLKYQSQVQINDWKGTDDVSGKLYCMYDKDNFYIAAKIKDDIFGDKDVQIWQNDSIQFAFSLEKQKEAARTEYGIGKINGEDKIERYSFVTVDTGILGVTDKEGYGGIQYKITRNEDEKETVYEAQIPWTQIYGNRFKIAKFDSLYFSCLVNDNDGNGRRGWIEFCPGIGLSKDPSQFIDIPLLKRADAVGIR